MFERLQYISQGLTANEQFYNIQSALDAGCSWIQLRFKNGSEQDILQLAEKVRAACMKANSVLIINDHAHIAKATDADGLHLGLTDMPVTKARKILGDKKIIGGTANTIEHVMQRKMEGCNYIGLGPFRFTATKEKLSPILGVAGFRNIVQQLPHDFAIPIYAIGGIQLNDIIAIIEMGIYGIAVSGLITGLDTNKDLVQIIKKELYATVDDRRQAI